MGTDYPAPDKLQMFCGECGGADRFSGRCMGVGDRVGLGECSFPNMQKLNDKWKGCYCVDYPGVESYAVPTAHWKTCKKVVDGGPWKDVGEKTECTKQRIQNIHTHRETWRFVSQVTLDANIVKFCHDDFRGISGASVGKYEAGYQGPGDKTDTRKWDLNYVKLWIEWDTGSYTTADECEKKMKALSANCDWSSEPPETNPNQYK